jgi:predicted SnoaL-like aldol condensation-catalyzing enzyme
MANEANKAIVRRLYEEAFNVNGDLTVIDEFVAIDLLDHTAPPDRPPGRAGFKAFVTAWCTAFPASTLTIETLIVEDAWVALIWNCTSHQQAKSVRGMSLNRFSDGRIVERWGVESIIL